MRLIPTPTIQSILARIKSLPMSSRPARYGARQAANLVKQLTDDDVAEEQIAEALDGLIAAAALARGMVGRKH